jgi:hypothetical protein
MANLYNVIGSASTVLGVASNLLRSGNRGRGGEYAQWAKEIPSHINNYGIQRDNLGLVICPVADVLKQRYNNNNERLLGVTRRTDGFNVPGAVIQTSDSRRYGIGPVSRLPVGTVTNTNFTINFVADQMGLYYQYFVAWMDGIVHYNGRSKASINTPNKFGNYFYEVSYFKDYAVDLTLHEMDERYNSIIETTLVGAYPISVSDKAISWGNSGLVTFNVEFAYVASDTKIDKLNSGQLPAPPQARGQGLLGSILKGASIIQAVSSMKGRGGIGNAIGLVAAGAAALNVVGGVRR